MHWEIVVNCAVVDPRKWLVIPLPLNKNLSVGTEFERALDHAGRELTKLANSKKDVTFWIRGNALIVTEFGGLKLLRQGDSFDFELKAQIEGVVERCFTAHLTTGESEWIECK